MNGLKGHPCGCQGRKTPGMGNRLCKAMGSKNDWLHDEQQGRVTVVVSYTNLSLASLRTEMLWGTGGNRCEAGLEEFCLGPCLTGFYFLTLLEL